MGSVVSISLRCCKGRAASCDVEVAYTGCCKGRSASSDTIYFVLVGPRVGCIVLFLVLQGPLSVWQQICLLLYARQELGRGGMRPFLLVAGEDRSAVGTSNIASWRPPTLQRPLEVSYWFIAASIAERLATVFIGPFCAPILHGPLGVLFTVVSFCSRCCRDRAVR